MLPSNEFKRASPVESDSLQSPPANNERLNNFFAQQKKSSLFTIFDDPIDAANSKKTNG